MALYTLKRDGSIDLHCALLLQVECFKKLANRTRKIEGDKDGRRKLRNRRELAFVFYMADWTKSNPIGHLNNKEKFKKAFDLAGVSEHYKPDVLTQECVDMYIKIQRHFAPDSSALLRVKKELGNATLLLENLGKTNETLNETLEITLMQIEKLKVDKLGNSEQIRKLGLEVASISDAIQENIARNLKLVDSIVAAKQKLDSLEEAVKADILKGLRKLNKKLGNREDPEYRHRIFQHND